MRKNDRGRNSGRTEAYGKILTLNRGEILPRVCTPTLFLHYLIEFLSDGAQKEKEGGMRDFFCWAAEFSVRLWACRFLGSKPQVCITEKGLRVPGNSQFPYRWPSANENLG